MTDENLGFDIAEILSSRGRDYGVFREQAQISHDLKMVMRETKNWHGLGADKKEALDMIAHKIARILNGDQNKHDSWVDIEGYAHLVSATLIKGTQNAE